MKVGLFFGSFNPIHVGHLIIANTILQNAPIEEVWFVVSPLNPLKDSSTLLHHFDRLEMVRLAIDDQPRFRASDIEFGLPVPSYTIDTLTYLQEKYANHIFHIIMGEDNLVQLPRWKNYEKLIELYKIFYYKRPGFSKEHLLSSHLQVQQVDAPLLEISATFIRKTIKEGKSIKYLVPTAVEDYIRYKKFYL